MKNLLVMVLSMAPPWKSLVKGERFVCGRTEIIHVVNNK